MEFISEMYDGNFQKRFTTSHGLNMAESIYGNLITATTPHFITLLDPQFFIQGTGEQDEDSNNCKRKGPIIR